MQAILTLLKQQNLFDKLEQLAPMPASVDEVAKVHTRQHIDYVHKLCQQHKPQLDPDTYLTPESYDVGLLSAGGALTAMRAVMRGNLDVAFSFGRPPGHHAEPHRAMGFCLFNNMAIAARHAQEEFGLSRIMILDWDVHHGNGTQKAFYHDPGVLFVSPHQSPLFPGTGHLKEKGEGAGEGYNVNIPLPPGCGDEVYSQVFTEIIRPLADRFRPELLMVSAGQDSYHNDPVASMNLSFAGFAMMARHARQIAEEYCDGKVVLTLEGGYHLGGLAEAVVTILSELSGWDRPLNHEPAPPAEPIYDDPFRIIGEVKAFHNI
ncbi:histone deacetylase family protein [Dethiobacter alkaliphilus]|uniref:Histone deacetylase superfamily n=1 Tax=Dethiobacter alkaliphilus AHT 1 TaxID=555088 RepID=C0GHD6_DETAL|nr:histone deacetylase [Dethiobacter alkaliphilus]EEG77142.1 histone deacetylase superfamily [Dethiobacter alkaliphilus AHT 1]